MGQVTHQGTILTGDIVQVRSDPTLCTLISHILQAAHPIDLYHHTKVHLTRDIHLRYYQITTVQAVRTLDIARLPPTVEAPFLLF